MSDVVGFPNWAVELISGCALSAMVKPSRLSEGWAGGVGGGIAVAWACVFSVVGVFNEPLRLR